MTFGTNSLPSNQTGLAIAEEQTFKTLPGSPIWYALQPNSYSDFGGDVKSTARNPIKADRQVQKGVVTDIDAQGGFEMDFLQKTPYALLPGFLFADWREKANLAVSSVASDKYVVAANGTDFAAGDLVFAENFGTAANNGLNVVVSSDGTHVEVDTLTNEASPPATAKITKVGVQAASGDVTLTVTAGVATFGSTLLDFTDLGLLPGEWIFVGGDATNTFFAVAACNGWYRVQSVAATSLVCDVIPDSAATNAGTGKTLQIFIGHLLKNESDTDDIVSKSYTLERQLAADAFEYLTGAGANQLELDMKSADKIIANLSYICGEATTATSQDGSGTRVGIIQEDAYNTTSNVTRIRMLNTDDSNADLFTFVTDFKLSIDNGIKPVKAIGQLGAFDLSAGDFKVTGSVTAYFTDVAALDAVRNNDAIGLDFTMVVRNQGYHFDMPYLSLSGAKPNVVKDEPVTLPIDMMAAEHPDLHHTMAVGFYAYLPDLAA